MADRSVTVLSQKSPHKMDAFFPTDEIAEWIQDVIGQDGAIAPENDLRAGRNTADDFGHTAGFVERGHNEVDTDEIVAP